jgi:hypothetical protein
MGWAGHVPGMFWVVFVPAGGWPGQGPEMASVGRGPVIGWGAHGLWIGRAGHVLVMAVLGMFLACASQAEGGYGLGRTWAGDGLCWP